MAAVWERLGRRSEGLLDQVDCCRLSGRYDSTRPASCAMSTEPEERSSLRSSDTSTPDYNALFGGEEKRGRFVQKTPFGEVGLRTACMHYA